VRTHHSSDVTILEPHAYLLHEQLSTAHGCCCQDFIGRDASLCTQQELIRLVPATSTGGVSAAASADHTAVQAVTAADSAATPVGQVSMLKLHLTVGQSLS
jgi:hypothetical protein